jgi:serine/threonine protein kinase
LYTPFISVLAEMLCSTTGSRAGCRMSNLEGVMLSDYLLLECISRGSVADVYRARQNGAGQYEVAVKVFGPGYAEREAFRTYFMGEAEKIGQFDHPHILPFIEYGEGEGLLYAVTPFVKSGTLEDLLKKVGGKFSAMQVLPIVQQLCDAVQYAHERDVIHGNLKPGNVFVANDGRMLLADFGIARSYADGQQALTHMERSATEYVAPEQSLGLLRRSSDIYSLGALFFRLLTGSPVFTGQTPVEVLLKHVRQEPPSARTLDMGISDAVDEVLRKVLAKRAEDRYQTVAELNQAFAAAVAFAPVASPVARSANLATRPLVAPDPSISQLVSSTVEQRPLTPSVPSPLSQTPVIAQPLELQPTSPQPPVLPEQHGESGQSSPEASTVPAPNYESVANISPYWSLEPVEWSPIAQNSVGGVPANAADYLSSRLPPLSVPEPRTTRGGGQTRVADYQSSRLQTLPASEPRTGTGQPQGVSQRSERRRQGLFLPILIVVLLLLGLLGALVSSFLWPAPSSSSSMQTLPTRMVSQTCVRRW